MRRVHAVVNQMLVMCAFGRVLAPSLLGVGLCCGMPVQCVPSLVLHLGEPVET